MQPDDEGNDDEAFGETSLSKEKNSILIQKIIFLSLIIAKIILINIFIVSDEDAA